jgi:hypothetical protein
MTCHRNPSPTYNSNNNSMTDMICELVSGGSNTGDTYTEHKLTIWQQCQAFLYFHLPVLSFQTSIRKEFSSSTHVNKVIPTPPTTKNHLINTGSS